MSMCGFYYNKDIISEYHFFRKAMVTSSTGSGTPVTGFQGTYTSPSAVHCYDNHQIFAYIIAYLMSAFLEQSKFFERKDHVLFITLFLPHDRCPRAILIE